MLCDWHNLYYIVMPCTGLRRALNCNQLSATMVLILLAASSLPLMVNIVPAVHAQPANLVINPGFESGLMAWSTSEGTAVYSVDSTTSVSGCCSAKGVETNTGSLGRLYQDVTWITSTGFQYQISGWIKTDNVIGCVVIGLDYVAANGWTPGDGYVKEIGCVSGTQGWTHYQSSTFTLPAMPADAQALWFLFDFNNGAGTAWFDDVSLVCVSCTTSPSTPVPTTVSLTADPSVVSMATLQSTTITATVLDQNGNPMAGQTVSFTTTAASLSATSKQTDANGQAAVTLALEESSTSTIDAEVQAAVGSVYGDVEVTFLPAGTTPTGWTTSSSFSVTDIEVQPAQILSPAISAYNVYCTLRSVTSQCTDIDGSQLTEASNIYFVSPSQGTSASQFSQAFYQFFGMTQCTSDGQKNCIPIGYVPVSLVILSVPINQIGDVLFNTNFPAAPYLDLSPLSGILENAYVQGTSSGYVNLAFVISLSPKCSSSCVTDLIQDLQDSLVNLVKASYGSTLTVIQDYLKSVLDIADVTVLDITSGMTQLGPLQSYIIADAQNMYNDWATLTQVTAVFQKLLTILAAVAKSALTAGGDLLSDTQVVFTAFDLAVESISTVDTSLQSCNAESGFTVCGAYYWFVYGFNALTSFIDPNGSVIIPSFYNWSGQLVLGFDPATNSTIYASSSGIMFPTSEGYLAFLNENPAQPIKYTEILNTIGESGPIPYQVQFRSYNHTQPAQGYAGMLVTGTSVAIPAVFNTTNGALIEQAHMTPRVTAVRSGESISVVAKAFASNGSLVAATRGYLLFDGEQYNMTQENDTTFAISLAKTTSLETTLSVYLISPNVAGGYGSAIISSVSLTPSLGVVGTSVTITGIGFVASHSLTVTYDGSTAGMPTACTADASGSMNPGCIFAVPASSSIGPHMVMVSDGTNSPATTFTVTLLSVTCSRSSVVVGSATTCKAKVHESSTKAPTGNVVWSSGSGTFLKTSCKLSKQRTYSTCSVKYTPTFAGSVILMANYSGDVNNPKTFGAYNLTVTMKVTTTTVSCTPKSAVADSWTFITCKAKVIGYLPTGTVSWSQTGGSTGSVSFFSSTTCTLASLKNPNQATCSVTLTGTAAGKVILQATYAGDSSNLDSHGMAKLTIKS